MSSKAILLDHDLRLTTTLHSGQPSSFQQVLPNVNRLAATTPHPEHTPCPPRRVSQSTTVEDASSFGSSFGSMTASVSAAASIPAAASDAIVERSSATEFL